MRPFPWLMVTAVLLAGCAKRSGGTVVFRDNAGTVVARGALYLPDPLPVGDQPFEGTWQLQSSTSGFPTGGAKNGACSVTVIGTDIHVDLNHGWADNNVMLTLTQAGGKLSGTWMHATVAGGKVLGTVQPE